MGTLDGWTEESGFQSPHMNSFNHYSLGSVGEWLYRFVLGIELAPGAAGFDRVVIRPHPGGSLDYARGASNQCGERFQLRGPRRQSVHAERPNPAQRAGQRACALRPAVGGRRWRRHDPEDGWRLPRFGGPNGGSVRSRVWRVLVLGAGPGARWRRANGGRLGALIVANPLTWLVGQTLLVVALGWYPTADTLER